MSGQPFTEVSVRIAPADRPRKRVRKHLVSRANLDMHLEHGLPLLAYCGATVTFFPPSGEERIIIDCWECTIEAVWRSDAVRDYPEQHDHLDWHPEYDNEQERDPS